MHENGVRSMYMQHTEVRQQVNKILGMLAGAWAPMKDLFRGSRMTKFHLVPHFLIDRLDIESASLDLFKT